MDKKDLKLKWEAPKLVMKLKWEVPKLIKLGNATADGIPRGYECRSGSGADGSCDAGGGYLI